MFDDDLVKAAMIEDEEDLRLKEEKSTDEEETTTTPASSDEPDEDEQETEETEEKATDEETEEQSEESDEDRKPTRRERREERRQRWLESVRKDSEQPEQPQQSQQVQQPQQQQDDYKPLDYTKLDEIDEEQLAKDRESYGQYNRSQGAKEAAETERFIAEQNDFWKDVTHEAKLLTFDPKYKFLDEKDEDNFDPDLASDLNEKYLEFVGFDPRSNTVLRTNISYGKFVKKEMAEREAWAERLAADDQRNLEATKATASVRPGGSRKSGLGKLKPGDISRMSPAEFAKYEAEIDKQINAELGI